MIDPISVTIKELKGQARNLIWCARGHRWIGANSTVTLDYEPWSCADRKQRETIRAELGSKRISLTMHVLSADGRIIDIDYDPSLISGAAEPAAPAVSKPMAVAEPVKKSEENRIIVGKNNAEAIGLGFKAEAVVPPTQGEEKPRDADVGFTKLAATDAKGIVVGAVEADVETAVIPADSPEVNPEAAPPPLVGDPLTHVRELFDKCVENKQWDEALEVLRAAFGDLVTFSSRTIMAMKDYDAIVSKYSLK